MSTPSALASEITPYDGRVIRIVEAQHRISTNRLAGNAGDQQLLEALADEVKPNLPEAARRLPWLLASPFRYGLGRPSRFRSADTLPGIFYASEDIETAVTEADKNDYTATHALADEARTAGVAAFRTRSARRSQGINLAVFDPIALVPPLRPHSSWALLASEEGLLATQEMSAHALRFASFDQ
jgi:hypothetical protein